MKDQRIFVTGGSGFLGSHFVRHALSSGAAQVTNFDLMTYAGDARRLADVESDPRYRALTGDVAAESDVKDTLGSEQFDVVVHYAAESHVTRSEKDPDKFNRTNIDGTRVMIESALSSGVKRFVHISTDEVYGPVLQGYYAEDQKLHGEGNATSPYAKSKAIADDLALSYSDRIEMVVARPTNAFGPWQFPEKAFPRWVTRALRGEPILVWGDGLYVRQWLHAEDFASAIGLLVTDGAPGNPYNVGVAHDPEITNIDLANWLVTELALPEGSIEMTAYDRPDHDRRYAVDPTQIQALGWQPGDVMSQLASTVEWYRDNEAWWRSHVDEAESIYTDAGKA